MSYFIEDVVSWYLEFQDESKYFVKFGLNT